MVIFYILLVCFCTAINMATDIKHSSRSISNMLPLNSDSVALGVPSFANVFFLTPAELNNINESFYIA